MAGETWPVAINASELSPSLTNLSESNFSDPIHLTNYTDLVNFTQNMSYTNSTQTANGWFAPFNDVWVGMIFGAWIYVIIILALTVMVYVKNRSLTTASMVLLLSSLCVEVTSSAGIVTIPAQVQPYIFTLIGLGIAASFISAFSSDR